MSSLLSLLSVGFGVFEGPLFFCYPVKGEHGKYGISCQINRESFNQQQVA